MASNGAPQRPVKVQKTGVELDADAAAERQHEEAVAWEGAWSSYGNGAAMNLDWD